MANITYIKVCLEDEIRYAETLLTLLDAERQALAKNNGDSLEKIAKDKRQVAEQLDESAQRRRQQLTSGEDPHAGDMQAFITAQTEEFHQPLQKLWDQLLDVLGRCREQNHLNGSVLENSQRNIKQLIALLQGQTQNKEIYGRGGKIIDHSLEHSLTRA
ncbi:flagella synthesis protein FlgN [Sulfuriflexus mobilis]|uniref:flagella synthesis protein FlgN n=1 Tax=Sulfuriflexus mobilis TaxID=1811807 RepID=UPI000F83EAE3|nr:flagellar protein FlgN [Sulfuriflexus mobilis]